MKNIQNAMMINGKIIISISVHDCKIIKVKGKDKKYYIFMVDGGLEYLRRAVPTYEKGVLYVEDLTLTTENTIEEIKNKLIIGVREVKTDKMLYIKLVDCDLDKIKSGDICYFYHAGFEYNIRKAIADIIILEKEEELINNNNK